MKNIKIFAVMAMVMVIAATIISCNKDFDNVTKSTLPQVPTNVEMKWRAMGNKDSVRVIYQGGSFVAAAPRMNGGNTYMRQGTNALAATGDTTVALTANTASVVFAHNYGISDTISIDLGIDVVVMRWNPATGQTELSNEKVYPAEAMGIFENIEKTYPQEANGFYEINAMRYTLAEVSNPSLMAGRVSSKATIYELSSDTIVVTDTVVVVDTIPGGGTTPDRNWLYNDTTISHISVNTTGVYSNGVVTWSHVHQRVVTEYWDANPFTVAHTPETYNRYYPFSVTTNGQPTSAMIGTTVNVVNGVANFGGYTVTLTPQTPYSSVANDTNCPFTLTTATMEADGPRVYAVSDGTTVNVKIPENFPPTPADTINIFNGEMVYYAITASYRNSAQSSSDVDWFVNVVILNGGQYKVYYSPLASTAAGLNFTFKGTITSAEFNNLVSVSNFTAAAESGNRRGLAMAYHHNDNSVLDITTVKYSAGTSQVKYYSLDGALHSAHSAIGQTLGNVSSEEPVREGGVKTGNGIFTFIYGGSVVK